MDQTGDIDQLMMEAEYGRELWLSYHLDSYDFVLLLCEEDWEIRKLLVDLFGQKLLQGGYNGIVISDQTIETKSFCEVIVWSEKMIDSVLRLYMLYEFTDRLIIGALEKPYGRSIKNFVGFKNLALEDIISMAIFDMEGGRGDGS